MKNNSFQDEKWKLTLTLIHELIYPKNFKNEFKNFIIRMVLLDNTIVVTFDVTILGTSGTNIVIFKF